MKICESGWKLHAELGLTLTRLVDPSQHLIIANRLSLADRGSRRRRLYVSREISVGVVKFIDFCRGRVRSPLSSILASRCVPPAEWVRYLLTSVFAATLFVIGFRHIGGSMVRQLSMLLGN